jgi:hypothetical protein
METWSEEFLKGGKETSKKRRYEQENTKKEFPFNSTPKQEVLGRTNRLLSYETTRTPKKTTPPTILRCCGNVFTELLPSNDKGI